MGLSPAVAGGHPATAEAGAEILEAGGSAADAAVAAVLASCVAETVMTGLLGGGHALYWDAAERRAWNLDCFCAVPAEAGGELRYLEVPFGEELVHYAIGPASFAVPGVPDGLGRIWDRFGRLPWREVCAPAMRLARVGVEMTPAQATCLVMLASVMTLDRGAEIYSPGGRLLEAGDTLRQPSLEKALGLLSAEGARSVYEGTIAESVLLLMRDSGGAVTRGDLRAYRAEWHEPVSLDYAGVRVLTRAGLSGVAELLRALPSLRELSATERVHAVLPLLEAREVAQEHTTNVTVVDGEGNACVFTTSLGLGSGDFLPGLDLHLNSMLGEADLLVGGLAPGGRMASMMAPTLAYDSTGPALAIGAAGGTRLRGALGLVAAGILEEGLEPQAAVDRPRFHPVGPIVNAEPGVNEEALAAIESAGRTVRRWPGRHHYFGGVSLIARAGAAADPRRSGAVRAPR